MPTTHEEIEDAVTQVWFGVSRGEYLPPLARLRMIEGFWALRLARERAQGEISSCAPSFAPRDDARRFRPATRDLMSVSEAAEVLQVTTRTLIYMRENGDGPRWITVGSGGRVKYLRKSVMEFQRERMRA